MEIIKKINFRATRLCITMYCIFIIVFTYLLIMFSHLAVSEYNMANLVSLIIFLCVISMIYSIAIARQSMENTDKNRENLEI